MLTIDKKRSTIQMINYTSHMEKQYIQGVQYVNGQYINGWLAMTPSLYLERVIQKAFTSISIQIFGKVLGIRIRM